jgi:cell division protease FtsH
MVVYYGMNKKIGTMSFYDSTGQNEYGFTKPSSEKTSEEIDSEVRNMIENAHQKAITIIEQNKEKLTTLAETLLTNEVIFRDDLEKLLGPRPNAENLPQELETTEQTTQTQA